MSIKIKSYLLVIFCVFTAFSCIDTTPEKEITQRLELSVNELTTIESSGGTVTFNITSTTPWEISGVQDWCVVSPVLGLAGTTEVTVTCPENNSYDERNSGIVISNGTLSKNLLVTQKQKDALLLSSNKVEMDSDGGEYFLEIKSNVTYTSEIEDACTDWIKKKENRGLMTQTLYFEIAKNDNVNKREGKIRIKSDTQEEVVTIFQEGFKPTIVLSKNTYNVDSRENVVKIELKSNVAYEMILPHQVFWLQELDTRAVSSYTHYLSISANESYDMRKAEIYFINTEFNLEEKVSIVQMQQDAILVAQNEYIISATTTNLVFEVNTNVDFNIKTSASWIKERYNKSRALETVPVHFEIDKNLSSASREGYIYISYGNIRQTIKVIQEGRIDYGRLSITHTNTQFQVPLLVGNDLFGNINWGDGQTENYKKGITYFYTNESEHKMNIECWGAEEVRISGIKGISEINLSEF